MDGRTERHIPVKLLNNLRIFVDQAAELQLFQHPLIQIHTLFPRLQIQHRVLYLVAAERMKRMMKRTVWALGRQIQKGLFVPENYEISFSGVSDLEAVNITLSPEEELRLKGRIDRMDRFTKADRASNCRSAATLEPALRLPSLL